MFPNRFCTDKLIPNNQNTVLKTIENQIYSRKMAATNDITDKQTKKAKSKTQHKKRGKNTFPQKFSFKIWHIF